MRSKASWLGRGLAAVLVLGATAGGVHQHLRTHLTPEGRLAEGLRVDGEPVVSAQRSAEAVAEARRRAIESTEISIFHEDRELLSASLGELGVRVDEGHLVEALRSVGHDGSIFERLDDAARARTGAIDLHTPFRLPAREIVTRLRGYKLRHDHRPTPARWDFEAEAPTDHEVGARVDLHATVEAVTRAVRRGERRVELVVERIAPRATRSAVAAIDQSAVLADYETRYGYTGGEASRAQNVARAAEGIDGLVMMPGEAISFNDRVGPRSIENGFAPAGEIYKGEMRMGIGGGTCQVASTFHAAAFYGALEVVERSPHSRPSGYIGVGLDATVAYPHVDLIVKNPLPFPVVIRAVAGEGTLRVEVRGERKIAEVTYASATVGVKAYERDVREASWLEEGEIIRKQGGRKGITVERTRTLEFSDGHRRVETTRDRYPPTDEIYYVPAGGDPGELLPPLPPGVKES